MMIQMFQSYNKIIEENSHFDFNVYTLISKFYTMYYVYKIQFTY